MIIECAGFTDTGIKRSVNQDFYFIQDNPFDLDQGGSYLFILADGMGGHAAGEIASRLAVSSTKTTLLNSKITESTENIDQVIINAIENANDTIWSLAQEKEGCEGMGTTLVVGVVVKDNLYLGNVGDSRGYTFRKNQLQQETRDHSLVAEQVRLGIITKEQALTHPSKHLINRAVGVREFVKTDIFKVKMIPEDVILLCSDGLVDYSQEEQVSRILADKNSDINEKAQKLIRLANDGGGGDNITVVLVKFKESNPPGPKSEEEAG